MDKKKWIDRGWYLVSDFTQSNSNNFQKAVTIARTLPNFIELCDQNGTIIYRNIFRKETIVQFQPLYNIISKWKNSKIYINGNEVKKLPAGVKCMISNKGECLNKYKLHDFIGCIKYNIGLKIKGEKEWGKTKYWFEYSEFKKDHFEIKKSFIIKDYEKIISDENYIGCPLFNPEQDIKVIQLLPDIIRLKEEKIKWIVKKKPIFNGLTVRVNIENTLYPAKISEYNKYIEKILNGAFDE